VEALAQAANLLLVQLALAVHYLGDDARSAEDICEILLLQAVLLRALRQPLEASFG
jgi:hypothetical protein